MHNEIGKVQEVYVGFEDHGLFCYLVSFDFGGSVQSYGPFIIGSNTKALDRGEWDETLHKGMRKLIELHEFFKVDTLTKAVGKYIEVERESAYGKIERMRRLPVDGGAVFDMKE